MHRKSARKLTLAMQVVTVGAIAGAVLGVMAPRRTVEAPPPPIVDTPRTDEPGAIDAGEEMTTPQHDWTVLVAALNASREPIAGRADADEPDEALASAETDDETTDESPAQPGPPGWQYIGYAQTGDDTISALLTINERQRFVRPGVELDNFTISDITTDRVLLSRQGLTYELKRAEPLPFDASAAGGDARTRLRREVERSRTQRLEQLRMQQLEEDRARAIEEERARQAGEERE